MRCIAVILLVVAFVPTRLLAYREEETKTIESLSLNLYGKDDGELMGKLRFNTFPGVGLVVFADTPVTISTGYPHVMAQRLRKGELSKCDSVGTKLGGYGDKYFFWTKLRNIKDNLDFVTAANHPKGTTDWYNLLLSTSVVLYAMDDASAYVSRPYSYGGAFEAMACGIITDTKKEDEDFRLRMFPISTAPPPLDPSAIAAMKSALIVMLLAIIVFILL